MENKNKSPKKKYVNMTIKQWRVRSAWWCACLGTMMVAGTALLGKITSEQDFIRSIVGWLGMVVVLCFVMLCITVFSLKEVKENAGRRIVALGQISICAGSLLVLAIAVVQQVSEIL